MNENIRAGATALSLRSPFSAVGKQGAPSELEKARAETECVRAEATAAKEKAEQARATLLKSTRDAKVRLRATAAVMMMAALTKMGWEAANAPMPTPVPVVAQALPASSTPMSVSSAQQSDAAAATDNSAGSQALERLRNAFHSFPDEDQPAVVREVNEEYGSAGMTCSLAWNEKGFPALYLDNKNDAIPPLLAKALNQCAAGVEKLRAEKDEASRR